MSVRAGPVLVNQCVEIGFLSQPPTGVKLNAALVILGIRYLRLKRPHKCLHGRALNRLEFSVCKSAMRK